MVNPICMTNLFLGAARLIVLSYLELNGLGLLLPQKDLSGAQLMGFLAACWWLFVGDVCMGIP